MNRDKNGRFMKTNTTKSNITFSVTKNGKPLDKSLYTWDEKTKTFSSEEDNLVLDFSGIDGVMFRTSCNCTFTTGHYCIFNTEHYCVFNTGFNCTFITDSDCTFKTGSGCTFNTYAGCTFNTGSGCTFKTKYNCTFTTGSNCFITRYDVEGVTEIPINKTIKLNGYEVDGYTIIDIEEKKEIVPCVDKVVEIDGKKYKLVKV